jgi:hypothetical protein
MKFNKIAKSVVAASALTLASFGANANAIATAEVDIQDLFFSFTLGAGETVAASPVSFSGTNTSGTINGSGSNTAWTSGAVDLEYLQGSGYDTTETGVAATASIDGSIVFDPANVPASLGTDGLLGSDGKTFASASATGNNSAESNSNIDNTFAATFDLTATGAPSIALGITFGYFVDLYTEITNEKEGQLAKAGFGFTIDIKDSNCGIGCATPAFSYNLANVIGGSEIQSDEPFENITFSSGPTAEAFSFDMLDGITYQVTITQKSNANVVSVPEPTSVAILGLGLLGLAGAARRKA